MATQPQPNRTSTMVPNSSATNSCILVQTIVSSSASRTRLGAGFDRSWSRPERRGPPGDRPDGSPLPCAGRSRRWAGARRVRRRDLASAVRRPRRQRPRLDRNGAGTAARRGGGTARRASAGGPCARAGTPRARGLAGRRGPDRSGCAAFRTRGRAARSAACAAFDRPWHARWRRRPVRLRSREGRADPRVLRS